jgi:hypothetical protein
MMEKSFLAPDDRISQTAQKIASFRNLEVGWHYGGGVPPTDETIHKALILNREAAFAGFSKTNAFPGIDGEIQITAYHQSIYLELTIEVDGIVTFVYEQDDNEIAYEKLTFDEARARLRKFRGLTWALYGLSTSGSTTPIRSASQALPLDLQVTGAESRLLIQTASYEPAEISASISRDSTEMSPELLQYSGTSPLKYFLKAAS